MALNRHDPATAIPLLEKQIKALSNNVVSRPDVEEIIEETKQPMYRLDIYATNGNLLYEKNKTTTLVANITSWDTDVNDEFDDKHFKWRRVSGDSEADETWNTAHTAGSKTLSLTIDDVGEQSTFYCSVDDNNKINVEASILVMSNTELDRVIAWVESMNPFVHIKYSMHKDGDPFYDSPDEMEEEPKYMGVCYTSDAEDPTDPEAYTWLLFKGQAGRGVTDMKTEYYLSDSDSSCIGGEWTTEEVSWQVAKWIWIRRAITWDDGTTTYTTPVLAKALNQANISAEEARAGLTALEEGVTTSIGTITSQIQEEKGRIDTLLFWAETTDTSITSITNGLQESQTNISQLQESTTELATDFGEIKSRVATAETQISDINGEIETTEERLTAAEQKITDEAIISTVSQKFATKVEVDTTKKNALTSVGIEFALSDSPTVAPTEGWSTTAPEWEDGKYMWQRTTSTKGDGTTKTTVTCISGATGAIGEAATVLHIDSSRGTVFKNNAVNTMLSVSIYKGGLRITDINALKIEYGETAHLKWYWQALGGSEFEEIPDTDSRIGSGGFTFSLSPADVDTKAVFQCQLIV